MRLAPHILVQLAAGGSLGLLAGAFFFQHVMGLAPCEMCIWQRWPHAAAIALGIAALAVPSLLRPAAALGALAMAVSAGLALLHTGVERKWWEGITECSVGQGNGLSADDLLAEILAAPVVRCDEVAWELLGLSMASWNGIISLALLACWALALRR
ncbi:disulfide bond formation protein B [Rhodovulum sp. DZ06]|uniref:disulfide bond formation protein B n=1 Tax=Rhodovulum sp. DZ06 TaxID=3425126 RepID=UPI003D34C614